MRCAKTPERSTKFPSFYMRRKLEDDTREMHQLLAHFAGCSDEEILLTRNTTESLNIVIMGVEAATRRRGFVGNLRIRQYEGRV